VDRLDELGRLADINLAVMFATFAGPERSERVGPLQLSATGIPAAFFNGAYLTGPAPDPVPMIDRAIEFMAHHDVPWLLWVREGVDDTMLDAGRAAGLRDAGGPPAMGLAPIPARPSLPHGLDIERVTDLPGIEVHHDLTSRSFGMPLDLAQALVNERTLTQPSTVVLVGRVHGEPVSTALVGLSGTTAGIYNVGTPPEHQRRGYGEALTWAAIEAGVDLGADHAILQASPTGRPVYERMGFVHLGDYVQLEGPPT
jgi:GNAT superfamily N-acetyltransferase